MGGAQKGENVMKFIFVCVLSTRNLEDVEQEVGVLTGIADPDQILRSPPKVRLATARKVQLT